MVDHAIVAELAPGGTLRAGINTGNFLLVTGTAANGDPEGVAPDLAREIAGRLGVGVAYVTFPKAGDVADAVANGLCDIGLIGAEPARAEAVAFTAPYVTIAATYLVPAGSPLRAIADVDRPGVRIAVCAGSAYDLWLARNLQHAELVRAPSIPAAHRLFLDSGLDALAGLRAGLLADAAALPGATVLDGHFSLVQQAVATARPHLASLPFLRAFVEEAKGSGLVARLIARHGITGLSVADPAD